MEVPIMNADYEKFNHQFNIAYGAEVNGGEALDWCFEHLGGTGYDNMWDYEIYLDDGAYYAFYFVNECDYVWFIMRWG